MLLKLPTGGALIATLFVEEDVEKIKEAFAKGVFTEDWTIDEVFVEPGEDSEFKSNLSLAAEEDNFSSESKYYRIYGHTSDDQQRYANLIKSFRHNVMASVIFDLETKTPISASEELLNGHSRLNTEIALYKVKLMKDLANQLGYKFKFIDPEAISEDDLSLLENEDLVSAELLNLFFEFETTSEPSAIAKDTYFLLHEFDRLLAAEFDWIKSDKSSEKYIFTLDKFEMFDPKGKHRRSYSTDKEMESAISNYTSNYMSKMLDYIPEVDSEWNVVPNSSIGFKEFCNAISTVYDWALNGRDVPFDIYDEALKGNKGDVGKVIRAYVNRIDWTTGYMTVHMNKLRGLLTYIYSDDTFTETKNLFTNQIEKTVKTDWMCYESEYDPETRRYKLVYKNLTSKLIDNHVRSINKSIKGTVYRYRTNFDQFQSDFGINPERDVKAKEKDPNYIPINIFFKDANTIGIQGLVKGEPHSILYFTYTVNENDVVDFKSSSFEDIDSKQVARLVREILQINIDIDPKLEKEYLEYENRRNTLDIFSKPLLTAILAIHNGKKIKSITGEEIQISENYTFEKNGNWSLNLSNSQHHFVDAGSYMNRLKGSEQFVTLRDLHGNQLPYFQLGAYMHDLKKIANDIRRSGKSPYRANLMLRQNALGQTVLRSDVLNQGEAHKSKSLSAPDVTYLSAIHDMWMHLLAGEDDLEGYKPILVQPTCNADKSKFDLRQVNLGKILFDDGLGRSIDAHKVLYGIASSLSKKRGAHGVVYENTDRQRYVNIIENEIGKYRRDKTKNLLIELVDRLSTILEVPNCSIDKDSSYDRVLEVADILASEFKKRTISEIEQLANKKGLKFYPESDISEGSNGFQLNAVLLYNAKLYWDPENTTAYKNRLNRQKFSFIKNLRKDRFRLNVLKDGCLQTIIDQVFTDPADKAAWVDSISGNIKTHRIFDKSGKEIFPSESELSKYDDPANYTIELNPVLEAFFYSRALFAQSITDILYGDVSGFASKAKASQITPELLAQIKKEDPELSDDEAMEEAFARLDEASRLSTQFKRNMIGGSTRHNLQPQQFGTSDELVIACLEDLKAPVYNLLGTADNEYAQDGAGYSSPIQTILENWSYLESAVGKTRKTIWGYHDPETGHFHEIKWACFTLTNEVRRNSIVNSDQSAEKLFKKMHEIKIDGNTIDLSHFWNKESVVKSQHNGWEHKTITISSDIYHYDYVNNKHYKLVSATSENGIGTTIWEEVEIRNGKIVKIDSEPKELTYSLDSLYNIDQLFGGAFIEEFDEDRGSFVESDANAMIMANIVCEHNLKNKFIAFATPHQAMKVSVRNRNPWNALNSNEPLSYFTIKTSYGGLQLDAEHTVEDGDVAEMMQTVAALIQNGYLIENAFDVYNLIGNVIAESLPEVRKAIGEDNQQKLRNILGKLLIKSFQKDGSQDKLGLAEAFVRRAEQELSTTFNADIKIPFSDNSVKGKFLSEVATHVNKAIKRRYPGLGTVQAPSYKLMSHYLFGGQAVSFNELCNRLHTPNPETGVSLFDEALSRVPSLSDLEKWRRYKNPIDNLLHNQMLGKDGKLLNPLIKALNNSDRKRLKIEDTVVIRPIGSTSEGTVISIKDIRTLDYVKNLLDLNRFEIYSWDCQPRELRAASTEIELETIQNGTIVTDTIDLYELDVTRAMFYIKELLDKEPHAYQVEKGIILNDLPEFHADIRAKMFSVIRRVISKYSEIPNVYKTMDDATLLANLPYLAKHLQEILQKINTGLSDVFRGKGEYFLEAQDSMLDKYISQDQFQKAIDELNNGVTNERGLSIIAKYASDNEINLLPYLVDSSNLELISRYNEVKFKVRKVTTHPPQIIMGRAYANLLGIDPNDNVWDVTGPEYFEKKLRSEERLPLESELPSNMYDCMFTTESGKKIFVMVGDKLSKDHLLNNDSVRKGGRTVLMRQGSVYVEDVEIENSIEGEVYTYVNDRNETFEIIRVNNYSDFESLDKSGAFVQSRYNYRTDNYGDLLNVNGITGIKHYEQNKHGKVVVKEIPFGSISNLTPQEIVDYLIESDIIEAKQRRLKLAEDRWKAYQETLNFIGARIPTQSMQSFSSAKVVMFANIGTNECWLPRVVTWLEGSDYDIDKWYLLGLGLTSNGTIATLSDISDDIGIVNSFKLPVPNGKTYREFNPIYPSNYTVVTNDYPSKTVPGEIESITTFEFEDSKITYNNTKNVVSFEENSEEEKISALRSILDAGVVREVEVENLSEDDRKVLENYGFIIKTNKISFPNPQIITSNDFVDESTLTHALNRVLRNESIYVRFETTLSEKKTFLSLLNKHSKSKRSGKIKDIALKNAVFYGIQQVVLDPISQINLHVPIAMDAPKEAAKNSPLAAEEAIMCIDDPYTIFKMQQANMSGKNVVGIGATSLKTFFASTTFFNLKVLEIKDEINNLMNGDLSAQQHIYDILQEICFDSKFKKRELRSLANLYWEPLLNLVQQYGIQDIVITKNIKPICTHLNDFISDGVDSEGNHVSVLKLSEVIKHLNDTSKYNNAADDISAVISAATDNAKELILSKLNATEEFADIYTYLLSTGEQFKDIAAFMTSPQMGVVRKYLAKSFLEPNVGFRDLTNAVKFVLNESTLSPIPNRTFVSLILDFARTKVPELFKDIEDGAKDERSLVSSKFYQLLQKNESVKLKGSSEKSFREVFIDYLTSKYNDADESKYVRIVEGAEEGEINDDPEVEYEGDGNAFVSGTFDLSTLTKKEWAELYDYVKYTLIPKCEDLEVVAIDAASLHNLIDNIIPACDEQKHFGTLLSVNKGIHTSDYEEYNYIRSFEVWLNSKCVEKNLDVEPFDFLRFGTDLEYQKYWIEEYEKIKANKNILAAIVALPHFNEMIKLVSLNRDLINNAAVFRLEREVEKKIMSKMSNGTNWKLSKIKKYHTKKLSEKEFQVLQQFISESIAYNWLLQTPISIRVPKGQKLYGPNTSLSPITLTESEVIEFNKPGDVATFIRLMNHYVIPTLIRNHSDNRFLKNLNQELFADPMTGNPVFSWIPSVDMNVDDLSSELTYQQMLEGFDELDKIDVGRELGISIRNQVWTVPDLFFLYDLLVNKGRIGKHGFTRFFVNQIKLGKKYGLNDSYYNYLMALDRGEIDIDIDVRNYFVAASYLPSIQSKFDVNVNKDRTYDEKGVLREDVEVEWNGVRVMPSSLSHDFTFRTLLYTVQHKTKPVKKIQGYSNPITTIVTVKPKSTDVIIEMINYFNSRFGNTKVPIKFVTQDQIRQLHNDGVLTGDLQAFLTAEGFIHDGITYITERCDVDTPFHELLHVVCAAMKYHKTYRDKYYQWLDAIKLHPKYEEMLETVRANNTIGEEQMKHGSDLKEEVLVELIADLYKTSFENQWGESREITRKEIQDGVINVLNEMFETEITSDIDSTKLGHTSLGEILSVFNSRLLRPGNSLFSDTRVPINQLISTIKRHMINKGIITYGGDCY